jgi:membrane protease YdiL (CAAX protease family)
MSVRDHGPTPSRTDAAAPPGGDPGVRGDDPDLRPVLLFTAVALPVGIVLLALSTAVEPGEPFIIAAVLLALAAPALVVTYRQSGGSGVRALLHDAVRLPRPWWWLPAAVLVLPVLVWTAAAAAGAAPDLTGSLLVTYLLDVALIALLINIWEEMAWTGFAQRRTIARWGLVGGSLVTAVLFAAVHLPLTLSGADGAEEVAGNVAVLLLAAVGLRLLIARVDGWSGRSLLTIGVLHSSFNASEAMVDESHYWIRVLVILALGLAVAAHASRRAVT